MTHIFSLIVLLLALSSPTFAADPVPPPACLDQDIKIQQLTRQVATLSQQLLCGPQCQQQFAAAGQASETAAAEEKRLRDLKPLSASAPSPPVTLPLEKSTEAPPPAPETPAEKPAPPPPPEPK